MKLHFSVSSLLLVLLGVLVLLLVLLLILILLLILPNLFLFPMLCLLFPMLISLLLLFLELLLLFKPHHLCGLGHLRSTYTSSDILLSNFSREGPLLKHPISVKIPINTSELFRHAVAQVRLWSSPYHARWS